MKWQARVFSRGRITVPAKVRRALRLRPGDKVEFEVSGSEFRARFLRSRGRKS